ncbi:hypothetical protein ACIBG6_28130 [Streptomyces sp. NPDC050842]|uniref:hypothetical protein n=1 Tax=Streptomyces sp. NPDC050842 TaxID=3365636 RepID=UPI003798F99D
MSVWRVRGAVWCEDGEPVGFLPFEKGPLGRGAAEAGIGLLDLGRGAAECEDSLKSGELTVYEGAFTRPYPRTAPHWLSREPVRAAHASVRERPAPAARAREALNTVARLKGDR